MPKFAYRIFAHGNDVLLAISDAAIVGKTFSSEDIEINVSKEFYSGKLCTENEAIRLVKNASIVNAVGKEIITLLLNNGFVGNEKILLIGDVPHAQIIAVR